MGENNETSNEDNGFGELNIDFTDIQFEETKVERKKLVIHKSLPKIPTEEPKVVDSEKINPIDEFKIPFDGYINDYPEVIIQLVTNDETLATSETHPKNFTISGTSAELSVYYPLAGEGNLEIHFDVEGNPVEEYRVDEGRRMIFTANASRGKWTKKDVPEQMMDEISEGNKVTAWVKRMKSSFQEEKSLYPDSESECPPHLKIIFTTVDTV